MTLDEVSKLLLAKLVKPSVLSNGSIACTQKSKSGFFNKAMRVAMSTSGALAVRSSTMAVPPTSSIVPRPWAFRSSENRQALGLPFLKALFAISRWSGLKRA